MKASYLEWIPVGLLACIACADGELDRRIFGTNILYWIEHDGVWSSTPNRSEVSLARRPLSNERGHWLTLRAMSLTYLVFEG